MAELSAFDKSKCVHSELGHDSCKEVLTARLIQNVVIVSFLKPLSKESKESKHCKMGHHMEKH